MNASKEFIKNYTSNDKIKIEYHSNGKSSDYWCDSNLDFRNEICKLLVEYESLRPDELLRDIFRAEAEFCRESWGASPNVTILGKLLITETKEKYIEDYFLGKEESYDTQCAVSLGDAGEDILREIIQKIKVSNPQCIHGEFTMKKVVYFIEEYIDEYY